MIKKDHKFSEIKKLMLQFKDSIDDYSYAMLMRLYAKKKNSNVVFQLIDMSIQLFKHKFTLTTLPLTSKDMQSIIVLLYCQSQTMEE